MYNKEGVSRQIATPKVRRSDPYENLAVGVIKQAALDYFYYRKRIAHCTKQIEKLTAEKNARNNTVNTNTMNNYKVSLREAERRYFDVRRFFYSDQFKVYSDFDGPSLYHQLEKNWEAGERTLYREYASDM